MRDFSRAPVKNPHALRVLVVDDEPLIRWSVAETLFDRGYDVVQTGDASGARRAVGADPFDVVLLDYRLPDSDDLALLETIRVESPATQVIMMTAFGQPEVVRGALALGVYSIVNKPFELQALASLVAEAGATKKTH